MDGALTTGTITKDGTGRLILTQTNSYSGLTDIRNGVVEVTSLSALSGYVVRFGDASAGTDGSLVYNLSGTATQTTYQHFHFNTAGSSIVNIGTAPIDIHGTLHIMEQSILVDGGTAGITISSQILGDVVIRIAGNVYSRGGALATTGGDLDYVGASAMALDAGARFIIGHGTGGPIVQTLAGLSHGAPTVAVPTPAAAVGFDPGMSTLDLMTMEMGPFIYYGTIGGSADTPNPNNLNLLKRAMGTQVLAGTMANTFTGLTKVSSGALQLQKSNGINAIGGNLEIQSDALGQGTVKLAAGEQIPNTSTVIINSGGNLQFLGSGFTETVTSLTNNNGTFVTGANTFIGLGTAQTWNGGTSTVSAGGLLQGQSYLITGGTNTVQGGSTRGVLEVQTGGNGLQFGGTSSPTLSLDSDATQAGSIQLTNNLTVLSTLTSGTARILSAGNAANPGFIDLMAATRTFSVHNGSAATDLLISASISNGGLTKTDAGTLQLSGVNTYTGTTTISSGTLQIGNGGTSGSLAPGSAIVNHAALVFNRSDTLTQGTGFGTITGTGTLTQAGSGTTILNGVNVVSGGTTVSAGSLLVGVDSIGSLASNVTVQNSGILGGSGTITGTVTVTSGGTYAPGNSPAIQTVTGDVGLGAGSIFEWELVANTATQSGSAPYVYDQVNVGGTLSIDSTAILKIMLNTLSGTVDFNDLFWSTTQTWQVFVGAGTTGASFTTIQVSADSLGQSYSAIHSRGAFNYSSGSITWTVPEVSSASVGVLLAAGLLRRQRVAVKRASE